MKKPTFIKQFEHRARRKRFRLIMDLLRPLDRPIKILDVGGHLGFWEILDYTQLGEIQVTLLNLFPQDPLPPNFHSDTGDARFMQNYVTDNFDVVLSNSVIGHVGCFRDQESMATEIRRIGKRYFVQTPNHYFPVDWRTLLPFFHFLPLKLRALLLRSLPITVFGRFNSYSSALQWASSVRNLTHRELRALFPEATIARERVLGFTKSFIVFHGFDLSSMPAHEQEKTNQELDGWTRIAISH
jgi:hypothetical protein